jgi:hypothetical protein
MDRPVGENAAQNTGRQYGTLKRVSLIEESRAEQAMNCVGLSGIERVRSRLQHKKKYQKERVA